jgi:trehalose 6-phosphate synthase/phosphatase
MQLLAAQNYDFILALGDDWTDEEMFKALPETAWSIRVGLRSSHAKFNLRSHKEVIELLRELVGGEKAATPQG